MKMKILNKQKSTLQRQIAESIEIEEIQVDRVLSSEQEIRMAYVMEAVSQDL